MTREPLPADVNGVNFSLFHFPFHFSRLVFFPRFSIPSNKFMYNCRFWWSFHGSGGGKTSLMEEESGTKMQIFPCSLHFGSETKDKFYVNLILQLRSLNSAQRKLPDSSCRNWKFPFFRCCTSPRSSDLNFKQTM
jgi:hypothetical protein